MQPHVKKRWMRLLDQLLLIEGLPEPDFSSQDEEIGMLSEDTASVLDDMFADPTDDDVSDFSSDGDSAASNVSLDVSRPPRRTPHTNIRTEFIVHVDDSLAPVRGALPWGGTQPDLLVSLCETDVEPQHERMAVVVAQGLHVHTRQHSSPQCLYRAESTRRCSSAPILKIS